MVDFGLPRVAIIACEHHAVHLLGHVDLVVTGLSLLLVSLALLPIAILVESGGGSNPDRLFLLLVR